MARRRQRQATAVKALPTRELVGGSGLALPILLAEPGSVAIGQARRVNESPPDPHVALSAGVLSILLNLAVEPNTNLRWNGNHGKSGGPEWLIGLRQTLSLVPREVQYEARGPQRHYQVGRRRWRKR